MGEKWLHGFVTIRLRMFEKWTFKKMFAPPLHQASKMLCPPSLDLQKCLTPPDNAEIACTSSIAWSLIVFLIHKEVGTPLQEKHEGRFSHLTSDLKILPPPVCTMSEVFNFFL